MGRLLSAAGKLGEFWLKRTIERANLVYFWELLREREDGGIRGVSWFRRPSRVLVLNPNSKSLGFRRGTVKVGA